MPIMYVNPAPKRRRKKATKKRAASRRKNATATRKRTKKNPTRKRSLAAKKAARTRAANKRKRSLAAKRAARRRNPKRKTASRARRRNPWREKKTQTVSRRVARGHRKAALKGWRRKRRGRKNPAPRYKRRYRRNPAGVMDFVMQVAPVAAALYGSRLVTGLVSERLTMIPATFRRPAVAGGLLVAGHFATTKVAALRKHRTGVMIGLGLNALDKIISAFAPENVKGMLGVSDYGTDIYGPALGVGEYVTFGATPLEDDITMADYVSVDDYVAVEGFEAELGQIEADLGAEMDLGDFSDRRLGGVARQQMRAPVGSMKYLAPVPARSFTKVVPPIGQDYDKEDLLYTGVFAGGNC